VSGYRRNLGWTTVSAASAVLSLKAPGAAPVAALTIVVAAVLLRPSWNISIAAGLWWILVVPFLAADTSSRSADAATLCAFACLATGIGSLIVLERRRAVETSEPSPTSGGPIT
jgi:hypothetical protein